MIGELHPSQIERVLHEQVIGRIGCHARGRTYVVPVTYAYDGEAMLVHTGLGQKVRIMRENPEVCFEVEDLRHLPRWESVIIQGRYQELREDAADAALATLVARLSASPPGLGARPWQGAGVFTPPSGDDVAPRAEIMFRIAISEKTGRFEH